MTTERFFPYKTAPERLQLSVDAIDPEVEEDSEGNFKIYSVDPERTKLQFRVSVSLSPEVREMVLPRMELGDPPVRAELIGKSIQSRVRQKWSLDKDGTDYHQDLTILRDEYAGELVLRGILVRTTPSVSEEDGFALDRGSLLAWSKPCKLLLDEPPLATGKYIEIRWVRFSQDPNAWLRRHPNHLFALEPPTPHPVLLLNEDVFPGGGARTVLDAIGTRGPRARVRDTTFYLMAHQVWSSLLGSVLIDLGHAIREREQDETETSPLDDLSDFQRNILDSWVPYLFPEGNADVAMERLIEALSRGDEDEVFSRRLPSAIQERLTTYRGFTALLEEVVLS